MLSADARTAWRHGLRLGVHCLLCCLEITFYISALHDDPATMPYISLVLISAVQDLYFIVAVPSLFLPFIIVLLRSAVLPRPFAYLALALAVVFAALGAGYMLQLALPAFVLGFARVQALWWLTAITLMVRCEQVQPSEG